MRKPPFLPAFLVFVFLAACSSSESGTDAGVTDTGADVSVPDTAPADSAVTDAAPADTGSGAGDAGTTDTGSADTGDAGQPDSGAEWDPAIPSYTADPALKAGCEAPGENDLCFGVASRDISPKGFEVPKMEYLRRDKDCIPEQARCDNLMKDWRRDCGTDRLCKGDKGYTAPDADGTEKDGVFDFFRDCGSDNLCKGDPGYAGPDPDGTEGNKLFDGVWLAGLGENKPAIGVHDPVYARAWAMRQGDKTVAMVVLDIIGLFYDDTVRIRKIIQAKAPNLKIDMVIGQATHVHFGPDTMGRWGPTDPEAGVPIGHGINLPWMDKALELAADAVIEAVVKMEKARLKVGNGFTGDKNLMRDFRDPQVINDEMIVIKGERVSDGSTIGTLVHWGNHPETLYERSNYITSDHAWMLRETVEKGIPATGTKAAMPGLGGMTVYLQGTVGGMMAPPSKTMTQDGRELEARSFAMLSAYGTELGRHALEIAAKAEPAAKSNLRMTTRRMFLELPNTGFHIAFFGGIFPRRQVVGADGKLYSASTIDPKDLPRVVTEMTIVRVGDLLSFYTVPGELFPELWVGGYDGSWRCGKNTGPDCKTIIIEPGHKNPPALDKAPKGPYLSQRLGGKYKLLLGLAQDELGYLVPAYDYKLSESLPYLDEAPGEHYEETVSVGPDAWPTLEKALDELNASLP